MKIIVYFKKRERFEKYMAARADGGLLTPEQAVAAYYEFMKFWTDFTRNQKIMYKQLRQLEQINRAKGEDPTAPDYEIIRQDEYTYWQDAFASAAERTQDENG